MYQKGVKVDVPLQTYFRINNENTGQFERTLIIVDEGASVHYVKAVQHRPIQAIASMLRLLRSLPWMVLICAIRPSKTGLTMSTTW